MSAGLSRTIFRTLHLMFSIPIAGYVYSPFDPGKYVDVSGYAPGSKVKDPYSGKIFKVP